MRTFFTSFAALAVLGLQHPGNLWSQTFQYTLQGEAYSNGSVVLPTQDGGFLLGGSSSDAPFSGGEAMIIKVSATGTEEWTIRMAGSTSEHVSDIVPTYDGNFIATGTTFSFNAAPYGNVLVFKFTPTGQVLWTKMYGGPGYDFGNHIKATPDSGFVIAGLSSSFGAGGNDLYALKIDSTGQAVWSATIGGPSNDQGQQILLCPDGGYLLAGSSSSFSVGQIPTYGFALCKLDAQGTLQWMKVIDLGGYSLCYDAILDTDNGFLLAGWTDGSGQGMNDMVLVKTDSLGNGMWAKTYGGDSLDIAYSMARMPNGTIVLGGVSRSFSNGTNDGYLVQTDAQGNLLWSSIYGHDGQDYLYAITPWQGNGILGTGSSQSFSIPDIEFYVIATDSAGNSGCFQNDPPTLAGNTIPGTQAVSPMVFAAWLTIPINPTISQSSSISILCQDIPTQGQEEASLSFSLFPNPSTEGFWLKSKEKISEFSILDLQGRSLMVGTPNAPEFWFETAAMSEGVYFIRIIAEGVTEVMSFVKTNP